MDKHIFRERDIKEMKDNLPNTDPACLGAMSWGLINIPLP